MPSTIDTGRVLAAIDERRLLELERNSIRIPSSTFEEGSIADFYANYLDEIGPRRRDDGGCPPARARRQEPPADRPPGRHRRRAHAPAQRPHGSWLRDEWLERRSLRSQVRGRVDLGYGRPRRQGRARRRNLGGGGHHPLWHPPQGRRDRHAGGGAQVRGRRHARPAQAWDQGRPVHQHGAFQQHRGQRLRRHHHRPLHLLGARALLPLFAPRRVPPT